MKDRFALRFVGHWMQVIAFIGVGALAYKAHETLTFIAICVYLLGVYVGHVLPKRLDEIGR